MAAGKMNAPRKPVERLFPFVLRSRILLVGRETLARSKSKLHFVLITTDLSENSRQEILKDFGNYPVVQHFATHDLARFFSIHNAKVIGFKKSGLAQSLYSELKPYRLNPPKKAEADRGRPPAAIGPAMEPVLPTPE
jgi:hypothetical protein